MKAGVVHHSLNGRGGSVRLAINTIELLNEMGFSVTLIVGQKPDFENLRSTYNKEIRVAKLKSAFPFKSGIFGIYQRLFTVLPLLTTRVDLIVNTDADLMAHNYISKSPLVAYCHFPHSLQIASQYRSKYRRSLYWRMYFAPYRWLTKLLTRPNLVRGTVLTNSEFSRKAIIKIYPNVDPLIVYPCTDTRAFKQVLHSDRRQNRVLVLSRFSPEKQLESAIILAQKLGVIVTVIGSLVPANQYYFESLVRTAREHKVGHLIHFKPNASFETIMQEMASSKVYLHTMRGEHFGISIVEAMSAGLIPIVPDYGGCSEFVPKEYQYADLEKMVEKVKCALDAPFSERNRVSEIADQFSEDSFKQSMKQVIEGVMSVK